MRAWKEFLQKYEKIFRYAKRLRNASFTLRPEAGGSPASLAEILGSQYGRLPLLPKRSLICECPYNGCRSEELLQRSIGR